MKMSSDNSVGDVTLQNVTPDLWVAKTVECLQLIDAEEKWQSIPLLNYVPSTNVKNRQLVRFRGMIQNMHNPEYFLCKYEVKNTITGVSTIRSGKLKDTVMYEDNEIFIEDSEHNVTSERETWFCVPIPALNEWVSSSWKKPHLKRHHGITEEEPEPAKRAMSDVQPSNQEPDCSSRTSELILPEPYLRTCFVKLYDLDTASYVLNDVIEVVGFVSLCNERRDDHEMELDDINYSKVPQIHVVACRNLLKHNNLLPEILQDERAEDMLSVRKDLHILFTQLLLGDSLAADYLLCHLMSSIYSRTDLMALGQLPLNIINIPKSNYVKNIYNIIEMLVMKSVFLPMSLENLNKRVFIPKKDYEKEQLSESLLQLSPHTHLVLDETQLQPGKLEVLGFTNMTALKKLVLEQKVTYDFQFYQLDFNCDVPVLVFSEGKSLIPCSVVLPLESDAECLETIPEIFQAAHHFLQPSLLHRMRAYILSIQNQTSDYTIHSEMKEVMQEDFVKLRQNKDLNTSADDFHNLIVLARLMSLSFGETSLTAKTWEYTLKMDMQRKQRLANLGHS